MEEVLASVRHVADIMGKSRRPRASRHRHRPGQRRDLADGWRHAAERGSGGAGRRGHAQHVGPGARSARIHVGLRNEASPRPRSTRHACCCRHERAAASSAQQHDSRRTVVLAIAQPSIRPSSRAQRATRRPSPTRCPRPRPFGDLPRPGDRHARQSMQQAQPHALGAGLARDPARQELHRHMVAPRTGAQPVPPRRQIRPVEPFDIDAHVLAVGVCAPARRRAAGRTRPCRARMGLAQACAGRRLRRGTSTTVRSSPDEGGRRCRWRSGCRPRRHRAGIEAQRVAEHVLHVSVSRTALPGYAGATCLTLTAWPTERQLPSPARHALGGIGLDPIDDDRRGQHVHVTAEFRTGAAASPPRSSRTAPSETESAPAPWPAWLFQRGQRAAGVAEMVLQHGDPALQPEGRTQLVCANSPFRRISNFAEIVAVIVQRRHGMSSNTSSRLVGVKADSRATGLPESKKGSLASSQSARMPSCANKENTRS